MERASAQAPEPGANVAFGLNICSRWLTVVALFDFLPVNRLIKRPASSSFRLCSGLLGLLAIRVHFRERDSGSFRMFPELWWSEDWDLSQDPWPASLCCFSTMASI